MTPGWRSRTPDVGDEVAYSACFLAVICPVVCLTDRQRHPTGIGDSGWLLGEEPHKRGHIQGLVPGLGDVAAVQWSDGSAGEVGLFNLIPVQDIARDARAWARFQDWQLREARTAEEERLSRRGR